MAVWTAKQLAGFLIFVREDWLFALWWLAALRGLRRGELCALCWTDLDFETGTITISRQLTRANRCLYVGLPKTRASERVIAIDTATVAILREHHHRRQQRLCRTTGTTGEDGGWVFCWPDGRPLSPDWLTHRFHHLVTASGQPPVRLHDLRHGATTLALTAHTDLRIVRDMLGHTSYAFTADTCTAVLPEPAYAGPRPLRTSS